jgi:hypothetical protein
VIGHLEPEIDAAYEKIINLCKQHDIEIKPAHGPAIDK